MLSPGHSSPGDRNRHIPKAIRRQSPLCPYGPSQDTQQMHLIGCPSIQGCPMAIRKEFSSFQSSFRQFFSAWQPQAPGGGAWAPQALWKEDTSPLAPATSPAALPPAFPLPELAL